MEQESQFGGIMDSQCLFVMMMIVPRRTRRPFGVACMGCGGDSARRMPNMQHQETVKEKLKGLWHGKTYQEAPLSKTVAFGNLYSDTRTASSLDLN